MTKVSNAELLSPVPPIACQPVVDKLHGPGGYTLWLWVAGGFLFLGLLWTGMFMATRQADTRTVPLATQGGRP